ncbi:hypothetical protein HDU81_005815 [Chytriomyces hyalinus]|nr:hypothetical protein HDU81_005815 [Chytriomyces hyalinus]
MNNPAEQAALNGDRTADHEIISNTRLLGKALKEVASKVPAGAAMRGPKDKSLGVLIPTPGSHSSASSTHSSTLVADFSKTHTASSMFAKRANQMNSKNNTKLSAVKIHKGPQQPTHWSKTKTHLNNNFNTKSADPKQKEIVNLVSDEDVEAIQKVAVKTPIANKNVNEKIQKRANAKQQDEEDPIQDADVSFGKSVHTSSVIKIDRSRIRSNTSTVALNNANTPSRNPAHQKSPKHSPISVDVDIDVRDETDGYALSSMKVTSAIKPGGIIQDSDHDDEEFESKAIKRKPPSAHAATLIASSPPTASENEGELAQKAAKELREMRNLKDAEPESSFETAAKHISAKAVAAEEGTKSTPPVRNVQTRLSFSVQKSSARILPPAIPISEPRVEPWAWSLFSHILDLFDMDLAGSDILVSKLTTAFQAECYMEIRNRNIAAAVAASSRAEGNGKAANEDDADPMDCVIVGEGDIDQKLSNDGALLLQEFLELVTAKNESSQEESSQENEPVLFQPVLPVAIAAVLGVAPARILDLWKEYGGPLTRSEEAPGKPDPNDFSGFLQIAKFPMHTFLFKKKDWTTNAERTADAVGSGDFCAADYDDERSEGNGGWTYLGRLWGDGDKIPDYDVQRDVRVPVRPLDENDVIGIPERRYVTECVATASTRQIFSNTLLPQPSLQAGCTECAAGSICGTIDGCSCLGLVGGFAYNHDALRDRVVSHVIECGDACGCSGFGNGGCLNRCVERWTASDGGGWKFSKLLAGLAIQATKRKGWGLFTTCDINHGSFIGEFVGTILTPKQIAVRRAINKSSGAEKNMSLFVVRERSALKGGRLLGPESFGIDATYTCNYTRFINHACNPNLRAILIYKRNKLPTLPRIALFARTRIPANTELTLDYMDADVGGIEFNGIECDCDTCVGNMRTSVAEKVRKIDIVEVSPAAVAKGAAGSGKKGGAKRTRLQ